MTATRYASRPLVHRTVTTPLGPLLVAASSRGLAKISYDPWRLADLLTERGLSSGPAYHRYEGDHPGMRILSDFRRQLSEYFDGSRQGFALVLDLSPHFVAREGGAVANPWVSPTRSFRTRTLVALQSVGYGETISYGELARLAGSPRGARAVGTACATNPLPIVIPCHRVLRADGSTGQYAGGVSIKEKLLRLERGESLV